MYIPIRSCDAKVRKCISNLNKKSELAQSPSLIHPTHLEPEKRAALTGLVSILVFIAQFFLRKWNAINV